MKFLIRTFKKLIAGIRTLLMIIGSFLLLFASTVAGGKTGAFAENLSLAFLPEENTVWVYYGVLLLFWLLAAILIGYINKNQRWLVVLTSGLMFLGGVLVLSHFSGEQILDQFMHALFVVGVLLGGAISHKVGRDNRILSFEGQDRYAN